MQNTFTDFHYTRIWGQFKLKPLDLKGFICIPNPYRSVAMGSAGAGKLHSPELTLFTGLIESGKPEMVTKMLRVIQETEFDEFCKWVYWLSKSHPQYQYTEETTLTEN